jgi:hypothetical protein
MKNAYRFFGSQSGILGWMGWAGASRQTSRMLPRGFSRVVEILLEVAEALGIRL